MSLVCTQSGQVNLGTAGKPPWVQYKTELLAYPCGRTARSLWNLLLHSPSACQLGVYQRLSISVLADRCCARDQWHSCCASLLHPAWPEIASHSLNSPLWQAATTQGMTPAHFFLLKQRLDPLCFWKINQSALNLLQTTCSFISDQLQELTWFSSAYQATVNGKSSPPEGCAGCWET